MTTTHDIVDTNIAKRQDAIIDNLPSAQLDFAEMPARTRSILYMLAAGTSFHMVVKTVNSRNPHDEPITTATIKQMRWTYRREYKLILEHYEELRLQSLATMQEGLGQWILESLSSLVVPDNPNMREVKEAAELYKLLDDIRTKSATSGSEKGNRSILRDMGKAESTLLSLMGTKRDTPTDAIDIKASA